MDILSNFKQNGFFTSELYHLLAQKKMTDGQDYIIPSEYLKEMKMSTAERLQNLNGIVIDNICEDCGKPDNIILGFSPRLLVFQNYKANDKIVAKFSVQNISKTPTYLSMVWKNSLVFALKISGSCAGLPFRLAPGMLLHFCVTFTPSHAEDYAHKVIFHTENDQYILPLIGMGPRPVITVPDSLSMPEIPLNLEVSSQITVKNVGVCPARFNLEIDDPRFRVEPSVLMLEAEETQWITVTFKPMWLSKTKACIRFCFETGEKLIVCVSSSSHTVSVEVEKRIIRFTDTYKTMARQETFKIINKSSHTLNFSCMNNESLSHDFMEKIFKAAICDKMRRTEIEKYRKLVESEVLSKEAHKRIYSRILDDEITALSSTKFHDMNFTISPMTGVLLPHVSTTLTASFNPKELGELEAMVFLDIDGVAERSAVKMVGRSLPPAIIFNLETLQTGSIYINKTYTYEIVAMNIGHINGIVEYRDVPPLFGSRISCSPLHHCMKPGDQHTFAISFCNSNQGSFFEEINFVIRETEVVLKLYLKGEIIYPSLSFSVSCLDFGIVSVGIPKTLVMSVINQSIVDVTAALTIPSDGPELSAITIADFAVTDKPKPEVPQWPREFNIQPSKIYIGPKSEVVVSVTLTANLIRANQMHMEMELEKSDSAPVLLPVKYNAKVPEITPAPEIKLRACFVEFVYEYEISFSVDDLTGYYTIDDLPESTLDVRVSQPEGFIEPNSTIRLSVKFSTVTHGVQEHPLQIRLFGSSRPVEICHITVCGVRPIVTCTPVSLQFAQVKVATQATKSLTLVNDSPVSIHFRVYLLNKDSKWSISPIEETVPPESEFEIVFGLYLCDAVVVTNKAIIAIEKVKDIVVPLSATGYGTSIMVGPLRNRIALGRHYTKKDIVAKIPVYNCGTRMHTLEWSHINKTVKLKVLPNPFFELDPKMFKIMPNETVELTVKGNSAKALTISEVWYLIGNIEGVNKKELLLECPISAEYVDPKIEITPTFINFQYDISPYSEFYKITDIVTIKNVSRLPLDIECTVKPPFAIIHKQGTYKIPPGEVNVCSCISYREDDLNVSNMISEMGFEQSRHYIDCLTLKPVEPLRKEPLDFFKDIKRMMMMFRRTSLVREYLEDQEVMRLQILFDTTKHHTLRSKVYCDIVKIRFEGLQNKNAIKLIGRINIPNLFIMTPKVDFNCIQNDSVLSKTMKVQNVTPLKVCYRLLWRKCVIGHVKQPTHMLYGSNVPIVSPRTEELLSPYQASENIELLYDTKTSKEHLVELIESDVEAQQLEGEPDTKCNSSTEVSEVANLSLKVKTMRKIYPILGLVKTSDFKWTYKLPKKIKYNYIDINDVMMLVPHRGMLKPSELQHLHVIFKPKHDITVKATLEFDVLGGPAETIQVKGMSSDLNYKLNTQRVNFKIRPFNELASEVLEISNVAVLPFEYKTYLNEPKLENRLKGTILELVPSEKVLQSEEVINMNIVVRPGVVGFFRRGFLLEVGHLPHLPIEIFGWGVICQVYLRLDRPGMTDLPEDLGYFAIANMTSEYLEAVGEIFLNSNDSELLPVQLEQSVDDSELKPDWHICSQWDGIPSKMDIELSIERYLVINHLTYRPDILELYAAGSTSSIPGFRTTPYIMDFGVVITDTAVHSVVDVINYSPVMLKVHLQKGTKIPTWLTLKIPGKLLPGETGKMEMGFAPMSTDFIEVEQNVEFPFNLEVPCGVSIPIVIKSLCAVPYLASSVTLCDIGSVRCGDKVISAIPLKNIGKPTCIWYVTLRMKTPGPSAMTLLNTSGKYDPGDGGWFKIAFKPTMELRYEGLLIFRFHMNPKKIVIPVVGQGLAPQVQIIGPNISFPPTLPWSDTTEMYFGITNPCPFTIELIFAHTDVKFNEEEEIIFLLNKYYNNPEEIIVPKIEPGSGLPPELYEFRRILKEQVHKSLAADAAAIAAAGRAPSARGKVPIKPSPKPGAKPAPGTTRPLVLRARTEAEIVADEMKSLHEQGYDPLQQCLKAYNAITEAGRVTKPKPKKGLIIVFHGSPNEEIQATELCMAVSKVLGLPSVTIDNLVVEALCYSQSEAKMFLMSSINEMYEYCQTAAEKEQRKNTGTDIKVSDADAQAKPPESHDIENFETVMMKLETIATKAATPRSKDKKKAPRASKVSSGGSHSGLATGIMLNPDLLREVLTEYLQTKKFKRGYTLETLTSFVMKIPQYALTTILRCKPQISNIHLVLCNGDFAKWFKDYEDKLRDVFFHEESYSCKQITDEDIPKIVKDCEEMDDEQYENTSPEFKAVYIQHGLEARRMKYQSRKASRIMQRSRRSLISPSRDKSARKLADKSPARHPSIDSKKKLPKKEEVFKGGKNTPEYNQMHARYTEYYKNTYESLITVANNWVQETGEVAFPPINFLGQFVGASQKKTKKNEVDLVAPVAEMDLSQRGFDLTILASPCVRYKQILKYVFATSPTVNDALSEEEEDDILQLPPYNRHYTVLHSKTHPPLVRHDPLKFNFLLEQPLKKCECNELNDLLMIDDQNQDNVLNMLSKWHCTCGKKVAMASSQTSATEVPAASLDLTSSDFSNETSSSSNPLPAHFVPCLTELTHRVILHPGDLLRCKYTFNPRDEGIFCEKRYVEVAGWPDSRVTINVAAISDIPRLDSRPKKIFKDFLRRTIEGEVYKSTYLDDLKTFEFGPIFIGANGVYQERYTLDLRNSSLTRAITLIQFFTETNVFEIDKNTISLEPGARGTLTISAAPTTVGHHSCLLLFCVTDNPDVVTLNFTCTGVTPNVTILPLSKNISYGRHLLYRREKDRFIVKNDSILPVMWKVRNDKDFIESFILTQTTGIVPRYDNQVVPVVYIACEVGIINSKAMIIDIFDAQGRGNPMIIDTLYLSAECYDVEIEYAFENPYENFLNYGNVKVNSTVSRDMYVLNRGKYNVYFKLKKIKTFPEPSLLRTMDYTPSGIVPSGMRMALLEFECTPTSSMHLVNEPAFICSLLDGNRNQIVVAKFPICLSIASFYNTFTLFPLGELNFHVIPVGSTVTREVILNNTSKCPITYEIIVPEQYQEEPKPFTSKDDKKATTTKKIKIPPLKCGNFSIMNEDNLLAPGTSRTINIQFYAEATTKFEETIKFIVSDTCPAEASGVPLKLVGIGAMPTLDFWNLEVTFREHLILKNLSEYKQTEPVPHCIFVENSGTLHFFCVTVQTSHTAVVDLYNNGLVPCALGMKLHYQKNTGPDIFSLDRNETHIESLMHKNLGIIFTPKELTEYRAILEIELKLFNNQKKSFTVCLIGTGDIPRIQMLVPRIKHLKTGSLKLPVTCLGNVSSSNIVFKSITTVETVVNLNVRPNDQQTPVFSLAVESSSEHMLLSKRNVRHKMKVSLRPGETATITLNFHPVNKGRSGCDVIIKIDDNPYEEYLVLCEGEAFMEDVILTGLKMLPLEQDEDSPTNSTITSGTVMKSGSASTGKKKKDSKGKKSLTTLKSSRAPAEHIPVLRYVLNFGGCELGSLQKRTVIMSNNSEKVYRFSWSEMEHIMANPTVGYIAPGEEKDIEFMFSSLQPIDLDRDMFTCILVSISDASLTDGKGTSWDNRQQITIFEANKELLVNERFEDVKDERAIQSVSTAEPIITMMNIVVLYSAAAKYSKYECNLTEKQKLPDTFIYQTRSFDFCVQNVGGVKMKLAWNFQFDEQFPARLDKKKRKGATVDEIEKPDDESLKSDEEDQFADGQVGDKLVYESPGPKQDDSKVTLFSGNSGLDSVDTWFEIDLPFTIEPDKCCLKPNEKKTFKVSFAPLEAFAYKVRLKSHIENLDPYDQNIACKIIAKSLIPYVHLDIPVSDYLTAGRRKEGIDSVPLPPDSTVLEFNVLGNGCYKKAFNVVNPTMEGYEFTFEMVLTDKPDLIPFHCNMLKGFVEGGTSTEVVFSFAPTAPGVYESLWEFKIVKHAILVNLLVVGLVREPNVSFYPNILLIQNSMVGFTTEHTVILKNPELEGLKFEFKGHSLCNESGKTAIVVKPEEGVLKPCSETTIKIIYTPIVDGPVSFKIYCSIMYLIKFLTLCVNTVSLSVEPRVTYYLIGVEHLLDSEVVTNINLDDTASGYERTLPFTIANKGSATFMYEWNYSSSAVKRYLQVWVEPRTGRVQPGDAVDCTLHFTLKQIPVHAFPITLSISDGPEYEMYLYADIKKPLYYFSSQHIDFGKCIVDAPDNTYVKTMCIYNNDNENITMALNFNNLPELVVEYEPVSYIAPKKRLKITYYFRPKHIQEYKIELQYFINSLCEETVTICGEGVPLLFDLYEGCQKSFDMGPVKVGEKMTKQIEVMNHSKVAIDATMVFRVLYPIIDDEAEIDSTATSVCLSPRTAASLPPTLGPSRVKNLQVYKNDKVREQIAKDIQNAFSSLKVVPSKVRIKPHRKVAVKIQFKPVGMISKLEVQLNMQVLHFERPLVRLSGCATGMSLCLSQSSLQFGTVRRRGCKIMKVMLLNKGDFGTRFCWQPMISDEFTISPMHGNIEAHSSVFVTITFRPKNYNPFIKVWASCNLDNYSPLVLAIFAACLDVGTVQNKTVYFECPVREMQREEVPITNPSDDVWLVLSQTTAGPFETLKEFTIEANSTFDVPIIFKPLTIGKHQTQVLYSPLGESALFVTLVGTAGQPNPNGDLSITVIAKEFHTEKLLVHNITESEECYIVMTELVKVVPDKLDAYYEMRYPETIRVWGQASATCNWSYICYEPCEMQLKVMFIHEKTREYQFYNIAVKVLPSELVVHFVAKARDSDQKQLLIKNPLDTDAEFYVLCQRIICPRILKIRARSEEYLDCKYSPLVVGQFEEIMEVSNKLVGTYKYQIKMECLPATEKTLNYTTTFGSSIPIRLKVENRADTKTEFRTMVSHPCIIADSKYVVEPQQKAKLLVHFEPVCLGAQECRISFESSVAGEFVYNIIGKATSPKPRGPIEIKIGGYAPINFKNVYKETKTFRIWIDRDGFYVNSNYETLYAKREITIQVYVSDSSRYSEEPLSACMSIELADPGDSKVQWTYFLRGVP